MSSNLPALVASNKLLASAPSWIERGPDCLDFTVPLEADDAVIEGLSLRGRTHKSLIDRDVAFQLEFHGSQIIGGPICRIEWRPLSGHSNKGLGPKEYRHILQTGSHHHRFDLNWGHSQEGVLRGEIPIAVPILDDPENFRALLALVGKEFRINKIQQITVPPWAPAML
jgi:hypothetical protein